MESIITLNDTLDTATFYGVNNQNILCLKNQHPNVRVVARGYQVKVTGAEDAIARLSIVCAAASSSVSRTTPCPSLLSCNCFMASSRKRPCMTTSSSME